MFQPPFLETGPPSPALSRRPTCPGAEKASSFIPPLLPPAAGWAAEASAEFTISAFLTSFSIGAPRYEADQARVTRVLLLSQRPISLFLRQWPPTHDIGGHRFVRIEIPPFIIEATTGVRNQIRPLIVFAQEFDRNFFFRISIADKFRHALAKRRHSSALKKSRHILVTPYPSLRLPSTRPRRTAEDER